MGITPLKALHFFGLMYYIVLIEEGARDAVSWNDQYMDEDSSDDELLPGVMPDDPNKFNVLCEGVLNTIAFLHETLREFMDVKDVLLQHNLPPSVLLSLSITSSKLFRRSVK